jgi:hypothetical protein
VIAETAESLKGAGHFTLWFLVGVLSFWLAKVVRPQNTRIQLWGPFLPFVLASVAAVPYLLQVTGLISRETALHWSFTVFLLYPLTEQASWAQTLFGNFHLNALLLALAYTRLVGHYIRFIQQLRQAN